MAGLNGAVPRRHGSNAKVRNEGAILQKLLQQQNVSFDNVNAFRPEELDYEKKSAENP